MIVMVKDHSIIKMMPSLKVPAMHFLRDINICYQLENVEKYLIQKRENIV